MRAPSQLQATLESEIQHRKTALLFRAAGIALAVNIINATFLVLINVALHVTVSLGMSWWFVVVVMSAGRYLLVRRFHSARPSDTDSIRWRNRYIGATTLVATAWGAGTILFMWGAPDGAMLFTGLVLAGMVAGAVPILAPVPTAFRIYAFGIVIPLVAALLMQAFSLLHFAFASVSLVFLASVLVSARHYHEALETSIRLGLEQSYLVTDLVRARDDAESALAQRRQTEATLQASESRFRALFEQSPDPSWILRANKVVESNQAAVRVFRYPNKESFLGTHPSHFSPEQQPDGEESYKKAERMIAIAVEKGINRFEWIHRRADGSTFSAEVTLVPMLLDGQNSIYGVVRDVSDRVRATQQLQVESALRRKIIDSLPGIFILYDHDLHPIVWNSALLDLLGVEAEVFSKGAAGHYIVERDKPKISHSIAQVLSGGVVEEEADVITARGEIRAFLFTALPFDNDGRTQMIVHGIDITDRKHSEQQIEHLAYHDPLTGLPNRSLFLDRLGQVLAASRRARRFGAVLFVDLDQFKRINDVHGHSTGDQVLKDVAQRLRFYLRQGDTVARFGGDEFVILLPELSSDQDTAGTLALSVGEKIRAALEEPVRIGDQSYQATASIGVSLFPKQDESMDDLIREADIAMYRAKDAGRNALIFFEQDMQAHVAERYALEQDLRDALRQGDLVLFLQSQVNASGKVIGAEALVRWQHPMRGLVSPVTFIPLAEETGLIVPVGDWVLKEACQLLARLITAGHSLRLAVNVSPRQFHQANFVARVQEILTETGADPLYLTLEITENLLVDRTADVVSRMLDLSELGIRFSIDDFGTGYSSLAYLKRLPLNELKIDKSFVQDVPQDHNDVALVETILSMARHLRFEVVAEGVETQAQLEFLTAQGCEHFQGYFFHRPQPAMEWFVHYSERST